MMVTQLPDGSQVSMLRGLTESSQHKVRLHVG